MKKFIIFLSLLAFFGCTTVQTKPDDLETVLKEAESTATKWSDYTDLGDLEIAAGDTFMVRDVSDTTLASTGTQKQYFWSDMKIDLNLLYQPLDSDLTSIAALTTLSYGLSLLELANFAALGAESSTSNDFDPDRLSGDTIDDNLIDPAVLGPFGAVAVTMVPDDETGGGMTLTNWDCGETIAAGKPVYLDDTANEWMMADADAAGKFPAVGITIADCTDANPGIIMISGVYKNAALYAWTGNGKILYLSDTAGAFVEFASIPATSGDCVQIKAYSVDADSILVIPSLTYTLVE